MSTRPLSVITGASSGIGAELAALEARQGSDVVMVNRTLERSRPVIDKIRAESPNVSVDVVQADLADHDSIKAASAALNDRGGIDLFVNNAGVLLGERVDSKHGIEMHAQVNTIAPYLFGRLLQPVLGGATVLTVSTGGIKSPNALEVGELGDPSTFKKLFGPYVHSKLATAALMDAFSREYPSTTWRSPEPGAVKTPMTAGDGMPRWLVPIRNLFFSSPEKAALRIRSAANSPDLNGRNGIFVQNGKARPLPSNAGDPAVQADLLSWCREVTGV